VPHRSTCRRAGSKLAQTAYTSKHIQTDPLPGAEIVRRLAAGPESGHITGANWNADGGYTG